MMGDVGMEGHVMTRTHVILPDEVVAAIDELVGQRGRSSFLAEAAREAIKRRRLKSFLTSDEAAWKSEAHPELAAGADEFVRAMRAEGEESDSVRRGYR
jgi:metal-responsive CopG/Arc/MetJ family transcriptional regulator